MPSSTSGYGAYNPAAVDPYPIETDLAKLAVGNSPENAANLLDLYQLQRTTDAANYGHEMGIQHDFAKQQLAQQLQETYLKEAMTAIQHRGGASAYNQIVGPGRALSADLTSSVEGGLTGLQNAKILEQAGSGAKSAAEAGRDITDEQAARASNGLLGPFGIPLSTRNIMLREAGANARHAGGGADTRGPSQGFDVMTPFGPSHLSYGSKIPTERVFQDLERRGVPRVEQTETPKPLPSKDSAPTTSPAASSKTRLQENPNRRQAPAVAANESPGVRAKQQVFMNNLNNPRTQAHPGYADIVAGAKTNGGRPQVDPQTNQYIGATGKRYQ
jgi:hypothetical protein